MLWLLLSNFILWAEIGSYIIPLLPLNPSPHATMGKFGHKPFVEK